jgi:hypothetical protein
MAVRSTSRWVMVDLWDIGTYDEEILDHHLERHKEVIDGYFDLERKKAVMVAKLATWEPIQPNPFATDYVAGVEGLGGVMSAKIVRAFHYSRMTDDEIEILRADGIVPTSVGFLKTRVDRQVAAGRLSRIRATRSSSVALGKQRDSASAKASTWPRALQPERHRR